MNLTRSIARACAADNIVARCVAPGFIQTEMALAELEKSRAGIERQTPLGRVGTPDEVASVILFLPALRPAA